MPRCGEGVGQCDFGNLCLVDGFLTDGDQSFGQGNGGDGCIAEGIVGNARHVVGHTVVGDLSRNGDVAAVEVGIARAGLAVVLIDDAHLILCRHLVLDAVLYEVDECHAAANVWHKVIATPLAVGHVGVVHAWLDMDGRCVTLVEGDVIVE